MKKGKTTRNIFGLVMFMKCLQSQKKTFVCKAKKKLKLLLVSVGNYVHNRKLLGGGGGGGERQREFQKFVIGSLYSIIEYDFYH